MSTFLGRLLNSHNIDNHGKRSDVVKYDEILIACLLDGNGLVPEDVCPRGIEIWRVEEKRLGFLIKEFFEHLRLVVPCDQASESDLSIECYSAYTMSRAGIMACKGRIILLSDKADMEHPGDPVIRRTLELSWTLAALVRFSHWRWPDCGSVETDFEFSGSGLTLFELLQAVRASDSYDCFWFYLNAYFDKKSQEEANESEPEPVAIAAAGVVKKLSEMTGFGDAGAWGMTLAKDLRLYAQGELPWADVDKGILLSSPPGGGKTTFARALAAECGVELISTQYSEWEGADNRITKGMEKMFDGIRKKAAANGPVILFIDEIDSIGRRGGNGHNESWFTAIINTMLNFLDGAKPRDGIVVIAATNHPQNVDPALTRPGRLDRHIAIPAPDIHAIAGMVTYHLGGDKAAPDILRAAKALRGKSPSQIEQICRDGRRMGRLLKRAIDGDDIVDFVKFSRHPVPESSLRRIAIHEAGHVIMLKHSGWVINHVDLDNAYAQGVSPMVNEWTLDVAMKQVQVIMGGRAAEIALLGNYTAGAYHDLRDATEQAKKIHFFYGLGETLSFHNSVSIEMMGRVEKTIQDCLAEAVRICTRKRYMIKHLAEVLIRESYLDANDIAAALKGLKHPMFTRADEPCEFDDRMPGASEISTSACVH
jgi:hypothetical protein